MKLDLVTFHCTSITMERHGFIFDEQSFRTSGGDLKDGVHSVYRPYETDGQQYVLRLATHWSAKEPSRLCVVVVCSVREKAAPLPGPEVDWESVERTLQAAFRGEVQLKCNAHFMYPKAEYDAVMPLPLRDDNWKSMPFDEVTGLRLRKKEGDREAYNVILELTRDSWHMSVNYAWRAPFEHETPLAIMKAGAEIAERFVLARSAEQTQ